MSVAGMWQRDPLRFLSSRDEMGALTSQTMKRKSCEGRKIFLFARGESWRWKKSSRKVIKCWKILSYSFAQTKKLGKRFLLLVLFASSHPRARKHSQIFKFVWFSREERESSSMEISENSENFPHEQRQQVTLSRRVNSAVVFVVSCISFLARFEYFPPLIFLFLKHERRWNSICIRLRFTFPFETVSMP